MLWETLKENMSHFPTAALYDENTEYAYPEFIVKIKKLADEISNISPQVYKCAVLCKSELNTGIAILACFAASITAIPLSMKYGEKHCRRIIELTQPSVIIVDAQSDLEFLNEYNCGIFQINSGLIRKPEHCNPELELSDVAMIMCTSGTTGVPKGAMITQSNLLTNLQDIFDYFKLSSQDKILICRPLYHCAVFTGEFLVSLCKGVDIYFMNSDFNPLKTIQAVRKDEISVLCGTPTLFYHLCNMIKRTNCQVPLKTIAISGECMTDVAATLIRETLQNTKIYSVYGLTEASPRVSYLEPELFDNFPLSVGKPLKSIAAKVIDDFGGQLPANSTGELIIQGDNVMKGYYKDITASQKAIRNGWLYTGDIASINENGLIFIKCRKDNMIIRAGMNIYPQEIENALKTDENVQDALAYGMPDKNIGQKIYINVVPKDKDMTKQQIFETCKSKLLLYQMPDKIDFVNSLEKNGSGKLVRPKMRCDYD
jgi:long-chain acyl-CoA synthetase